MKTLKLLLLSSFTLFIYNCNQSNPSVADQLRAEVNQQEKNVYVIERNIPNAGQLTPEQLKGISKTSCNVLDNLGNEIEWLHSYVTNDKVFCVFRATNEKLIREHAKQGGFPADAIVQVSSVIDPSTAN